MGGKRDVTGEGRRGGRARRQPADGRSLVRHWTPEGVIPFAIIPKARLPSMVSVWKPPPMPRGMHQADGGRGKAGHGAKGGRAPHGPDRRQDPQGEGGESYLPHRDGMGNPPHGFWR